MITTIPEPDASYDAVIIGGGFAGSSSALLLQRFAPNSRVLILERATAFDKKVGEATVEISGYFLHQVLGLYDHLSRVHLPKHGLRYWFTDGKPNRRLAEMTEVGATEIPRLPAFQLNRSALDEHLLAMAGQGGSEVRRGVRIKAIDQGWPSNQVTIDLEGVEIKVEARWLIDASGRAGVLAQKNGQRRHFEDMTTSAIWARFKNVSDMDARDAGLFDEDMPDVTASRRLATNHFCGYGWWCWVIPLGDGETSIGLVYDKRLFDPGLGEGGPREAFRRFVRSQAGLRELVAGATMVESDFNLRHRLAYTTSSYAGKGWAQVADAATFLDPFYSPGLDHASISVYATAKVIAKDLAAKVSETDLEAALTLHNEKFARSVNRWIEGLYIDKYEIMGDAELMRCSFLVDTALYYLGVVGPVMRNQEEMAYPIFGQPLPQARYAAAFMRFFKGRLVKIARFRMKTGRYGRYNIGHRLYGRAFDLTWPSIKILMKGLWGWARLEADYLRCRLSHRRKVDVSKPAAELSKLRPDRLQGHTA